MRMKSINWLLLCGLSVLTLAACTATGSSEEFEVDEAIISGWKANHKDKGEVRSSSSEGETDSLPDLSDYLKMVEIPAMTYVRGNIQFSLDEYSMSETEVTQELYSEVMQGTAKGGKYPVYDVNWYEAALFCNAISKLVGLDTAYVYKSINADGVLVNLSVNYAVKTVRLPTEMEWEVAARAGSQSTYYWGTAEASKYAYYAQSKGPVEVASYIPNAYGLYDMGGNVAEWVGDWYASLPTTSQVNYTGASSGTLKGIRGGGWSDKVTALASAERNKKDPMYRGQTVGFRVVYSKGI